MKADDDERTCKVILLGEANVGKTSIISRFVDGIFDEKEKPTIGASFTSKKLKYSDETLVFEIWDTAGNEKYRSLTKLFYKGVSIAILVYDITRKNTFEDIKNFWYNEIKNNMDEDTLIAIAANKSDLIDNEDDVDEEEARIFAEEIGAIFMSISAKKGIGVDELFKELGDKFLDNIRKIKEEFEIVRNFDSFSLDRNTIMKANENNENIKKCCLF